MRDVPLPGRTHYGAAGWGSGHRGGPTSWLPPLAAAVILLGIYALTLAPGLVGGDTPEMITAARTVGIPHQPGYPLYVLVGRVLSLIPLGEPAVRVNLLSALAAAAAGAVLCRWLLVLGVGAVGATLLAVVPGLSVVTWSQAVVAEVYAPGLLLGLLALVLADRWRVTGTPRDLLLAAYVGGLAVGHQPLMVMLLPAVLVILVRRLTARSLDTRAALAAVACFVAPFTVFLVLPLRSGAAPIDYAQIHGPGDFFYHALGLASRSEVLSEGGEGVRQTMRLLGGLATGGLGWMTPVILAASVAGAVEMARADRERLLLIWLPVALILVFAGIYAIHDVENYLILPFWLVTASAGVGLTRGPSAIMSRISGMFRLPGDRRRRGAPAVVVIGLLAVLSGFLHNRPFSDRSRYHVVDDFVANCLVCVPRGSVLFLLTETLVGPFAYHTLVNGVRPDVTVIDMSGKVLPQPYGFRGFGGDWEVRRRERMEELYMHPPPELEGRTFCTLMYQARPTEGEPYEYRRRGMVFELDRRGRSSPPIASYWPRFRFRMPQVELVRADHTTFLLTPLVLRVYTNTATALAEEMMQSGSLESVPAVLTQALDFSPRDSNVRLMLADVYRRTGNVAGAEEQFRAILRWTPDDAQVLNALGVMVLGRGERPEAETLFRRAVVADPGFPLGHLNLGDLLAADPARIGEAVRELERFLQLAPQDPDAPRVRATLEDLRRQRTGSGSRP